MTQEEKLTALHNKILQDTVCPELAAQATQLVMGDGNPDADIVTPFIVISLRALIKTGLALAKYGGGNSGSQPV